MKNLLLIPCCLLLALAACKDKKPTPEPEEYFSFYADGVYYNYPQKKNLGFSGKGQTLSASSLSSAGYSIYGYSLENPVALGRFQFSLSGFGFPAQDTFYLDGYPDRVTIYEFKKSSNTYRQASPLTGKLIFSQRTSSKLTASFEFQAVNDSGEVINVTHGKFSIIPNN